MTGLRYQVGQPYLLNSIVRNGTADYDVTGHVIINTHPVDGVYYRAVFAQHGESPNGKVVVCTYCELLHDYGTIVSVSEQ